MAVRKKKQAEKQTKLVKFLIQILYKLYTVLN